MPIVDAQIHLWEKGTPSAHHRQEPYSAEQAIAGMDAAGVDRALIHPVLWDPDSNELAVEAVRKYPDRFAIMGWFYLDDPNGRDLVAHWKERPGMLGLRFYTNERHPQSWFTDGTLDWLWPAAERAGVPVALGRATRQQGRGRLWPPAGIAGFGQIPKRGGQGDGAGRLRRGPIPVPQPASAPAPLFRRIRSRADILGHRHYPDALLLAAMRDLVYRGAAVAKGPRPRTRHG
jgi:predicted TIM-barrel fold metal-dependent hydrolase